MIDFLSVFLLVLSPYWAIGSLIGLWWVSSPDKTNLDLDIGRQLAPMSPGTVFAIIVYWPLLLPGIIIEKMERRS